MYTFDVDRDESVAQIDRDEIYPYISLYIDVDMYERVIYRYEREIST